MAGLLANLLAIPVFTLLLVPLVLLATACHLLPLTLMAWCADALAQPRWAGGGVAVAAAVLVRGSARRPVACSAASGLVCARVAGRGDCLAASRAHRAGDGAGIAGFRLPAAGAAAARRRAVDRSLGRGRFPPPRCCVHGSACCYGARRRSTTAMDGASNACCCAAVARCRLSGHRPVVAGQPHARRAGGVAPGGGAAAGAPASCCHHHADCHRSSRPAMWRAGNGMVSFSKRKRCRRVVTACSPPAAARSAWNSDRTWRHCRVPRKERCCGSSSTATGSHAVRL